MTLAVRNTVIQLGAVIAVIMLGVYCFVGYRILTTEIPVVVSPSWTQSWFAWSWDVSNADVVASLTGAGVVGIVAALGLVGASSVFRRVNSAELYFFALFLAGLSFEQLRLVQLALFPMELPAIYGTLLTRLMIVARLGGSFAFFAASLYAVGVDYPRIGTVTVALGILAFVFVYFVPVDTVTVNPTMLHRVGGQAGLDLALLLVGLMTAVNYIIAGARGHRDRGFFIALSAVCVIAGQQMVQFVPVLEWVIAGVALLAYGLATFILITRAHFLWY